VTVISDPSNYLHYQFFVFWVYAEHTSHFG